jgi:hypothetical protein
VGGAVADRRGRHRVPGEEPDGEQGEPPDDEREHRRQHRRRPERGDPARCQHRRARPPARREPARRGRGDRADGVEDEDEADDEVGQRERWSEQPEGDVVVGADERAHQQQPDREEPPQDRVAQVRRGLPGQLARRDRRRREAPRARQDQPEREQADPRDDGDPAERRAPGPGEVADRADHDPTAETAHRVPGDVEPHGAAEVVGVDLVGEVGHPDGGQPREREPLETPQRQQQPERRGHGGREPEGDRPEQRPQHHRTPAPPLGQRGGGDDRDREPAGGHRDRQRRRARGDREHLDQLRQQRLRRVEQRERREPGEEEAHRDPTEARVAPPQAGGEIAGGEGHRCRG